MAKYILKRLGYIIVVFFLLSLLLFGIFKMVPGDPARLMVEGQKMSVSPEQYEMLYQQARERLGLDKPLIIQYVSWMGKDVYKRQGGRGRGACACCICRAFGSRKTGTDRRFQKLWKRYAEDFWRKLLES